MLAVRLHFVTPGLGMVLEMVLGVILGMVLKMLLVAITFYSQSKHATKLRHFPYYILYLTKQEKISNF